MADDERMDVDKQIAALNEALALQQRSVLQYALTAGSIVGLEFQAHAEKLRGFALAELEDAIRLVEKVTALGGEPANEPVEHEWEGDPVKALDRLIESEHETLETLQAAIEPTGREAASEAIEHRLEHMIMRKQEQVDYLLRAARRP
jgi:bacterioferritin (cytochrome b1)